jgi:hypothetical protein
MIYYQAKYEHNKEKLSLVFNYFVIDHAAHLSSK